jgi:acyl-CoA synthetase (AMP-forming)/AMP-acid ligase II
MLEALLKDRPEHALVLASPKQQQTVESLRQAVSGAGHRYARLRERVRGRSVALFMQEPMQTVLALLLCQGQARRLLLISADTSPTQALEFTRRAQADLLLGDRAEPLGDLECLAWDDAVRDGSVDGRAVPGEAPLHDTEWILTTSGTTSTPKLVSHRLHSLTATVKKDAGRGSEFVWGLLYDPCRYAGLQVVLQALLGGSTLLVGDARETLIERCRRFAEQGVSAMSATPTLWRKLLMTDALDELALRQITLGGEIADQSVLSALQARYPQARIRHVYASTEAGVGFSVADGLEGFPADWLTRAPAGISLRVQANDEGLSELWIRSQRSGQAYLDGPAVRDPQGWVATGDRVERMGERIKFMGRLNGAINVGGNKVFPESVELVLLAHPGVDAALVRARKSSVAGSLVEAWVVAKDPRADVAELRDSLRRHCRERLPAYAVPALISFKTELECTGAGKLVRST